ncbi:MAG: DJ-1/PfpI family protein [Cyclobacteriaceae bacterium]|jgi:transcriptional regulator GlxA family with amidase domain
MRLVIIVICLVLFSCNQESPKSNTIEIEPVAVGEKLTAGFLIVDGVYNSELMAPYDVFQHTIFHTEGGIDVFTVAPEIDTITTFEGLNLIPDHSYDSAPEIDILVVPSAENSMSSDLENVELISFVREIGKNARFVMSLCDGAFVLAKAGLINGKESTTFPSDIDRYRSMFPELTVYENVSFVHDQNLITSAGGAKSYDPALYLVQLLYGDQVAKGVGKGLVIDWNLSEIPSKLVSSH